LPILGEEDASGVSADVGEGFGSDATRKFVAATGVSAEVADIVAVADIVLIASCVLVWMMGSVVDPIIVL